MEFGVSVQRKRPRAMFSVARASLFWVIGVAQGALLEPAQSRFLLEPQGGLVKSTLRAEVPVLVESAVDDLDGRGQGLGFG